jgi:general secretion pathway protein K
MPHKSKGLALVTILLILAIATTLVAAMTRNQSLSIHRTSSLLTQSQTQQFAYGVEAAARQGLYLDYEANKDVDNLNEQWAKKVTYPIEPAVAQIQIFDLMGRFNINNMSPEQDNKDRYVKQFQALLSNLSLEESLAENTRKWLDDKSEVDSIYLSKTVPYRPPYKPLNDISELLLIEGFDEESFNILKPYVSVLKPGTAFNINTASATVIQSLYPAFSKADAQSIVEARGEDGFEKVDDFWDLDIIKEQQKIPQTGTEQEKAEKTKYHWEKEDFLVYSEYFELFTRIQLGEKYSTLTSLIMRNHSDGKLSIHSRDFSQLNPRTEYEPAAQEAE